MKITKATVVIESNFCDKVILETDLPNPVYPYNGTLSCKFETAKGQGAAYVRKHFDTKLVIVSVPEA